MEAKTSIESDKIQCKPDASFDAMDVLRVFRCGGRKDGLGRQAGATRRAVGAQAAISLLSGLGISANALSATNAGQPVPVVGDAMLGMIEGRQHYSRSKQTKSFRFQLCCQLSFPFSRLFSFVFPYFCSPRVGQPKQGRFPSSSSIELG